MPAYLDVVVVCRGCRDEVTVRVQLVRDLGSHYVYGVGFESIAAELAKFQWRNLEFMVAGTHASFCKREGCKGCAASGLSPRDWFCSKHTGNFQVVEPIR